MSTKLEGPFTVRINKGRWFESSYYEVVDMNGLVVAIYNYPNENFASNSTCSQYNDWWLRELAKNVDENWKS